MIIEQSIKDYIRKTTKGVVNLTHQQTREIIALVLNNNQQQKKAVAKLYRYSMMKQSWEFLYTVPTTNQAIKQQILNALEKGPVYNCYWWECYNDTGELEGNIYTVHNQLF